MKYKIYDQTFAPKKFSIDIDVLDAIDDYHYKSLLMQEHFFEKKQIYSLAQKVDDDLIFNVPIYDLLDRRYAAFSSFLEAIYKGDEDPKGNGKFFKYKFKSNIHEKDAIMLFYLFRLCGSGINYKPKEKSNDMFSKCEPWGTHGFGNFWIVDLIKDGIHDPGLWFEALKHHNKPFTDSKGYMIPQISYPNQIGNHMKRFILEEAEGLIDHLYEFLRGPQISYPGIMGGREIIQSVDYCNKYLIEKGFKRQAFVLAATMSDIAEYYPHLIDRKSMIYAGTNAKRCIDAIFTKTKGVKRLEFESACIQFLADRYQAPPYSVEDSRLCDVVRYFQEYQSIHHIKANNGRIYKNNTTLKKIMSEDEYKEFVIKISK